MSVLSDPAGAVPGLARSTRALAVLERWFHDHHAWLLGRVQLRLRNMADAQDVAAETFAQVAGVGHDQRDLAQVREPRAFLTTIAKRQVFQLWRRRDLELACLEALAIQADALAPSAEERVQFLQALEQVAGALEGLPPKAQQAFLFSQLDGLGYAEIGERLGVSASRVRQYMAQAFRHLASAADVL